MQMHFERAAINCGICIWFRSIGEADTGDWSKCEAAFKTNRVLKVTRRDFLGNLILNEIILPALVSGV
jgi:hypothetical protein